jgi:adenylosuccinate synthase
MLIVFASFAYMPPLDADAIEVRKPAYEKMSGWKEVSVGVKLLITYLRPMPEII